MTNPEHDYAAEERMRGAAKEMYEALKAMAPEGVESMCDQCGGDPGLCDESCGVRKARAAIAKAEGRS